MIIEMEKEITVEYGGITKFDMEDCHAHYFINEGEDGQKSEFKVVKETGIVEKRPLGSEDWGLTFLEFYDFKADRESSTEWV
ncbi:MULTISPECIES: hypothetical protein [unclassified Paenibacillus]|uniref:Uncharacterized protein n=1 Tax=Paenibacillus provencensis TaxID=441151 RepID=A0ABW3Q4H7_9BACL|nr:MULTISPECIES: hypothetical protein [unclassified Paenibacillus]MCM3130227.1 hypothetical protein [Paenibacillus sp. MER 78]SDX72085.1 hypothetical protein SAMN05518848_112118 [Paenibacillus sp. PDC88]SFS89100.1 hypothetical protein SAMN04488601_106114 [Paenibacillus sp. 453mf]